MQEFVKLIMYEKIIKLLSLGYNEKIKKEKDKIHESMRQLPNKRNEFIYFLLYEEE